MSASLVPARQRGIALIMVMWVLALLTLMAVSLTTARRTETALTDNHVSAARFRALADAAVAYTALDFMMSASLEQREEEGNWLPNGVARRWSFNGTDIDIAVFNEGSRVNINQAQPDLLYNLLTVLGVEEEQAGPLADAIVDWRDEDDSALLNGAEDPDYEDAGYAVGAKDAEYETVVELRSVLGMTEEIYDLLLPEITVDGTSASPDEAFASPAVLAAVRGISMEDALAEVATRDSTTVPDATAAQVVDRGGPLYRVQITGSRGETAKMRMEALIDLRTGQQPPYVVLWRRYGVSLQNPTYGVLDEDTEAGD